MDPSAIDLSSVEHELLTWAALVVASALLLILKRLAAWLGLKLSAERQAALSSAVDRMLTLGVTKSEGIIADKGWNHIDSKNAVINQALPALIEKFPKTLSDAGLDPEDPADRQRILDVMTRMIPEVFAKASASPATPPVAPAAPAAA